MNFDSSKITRSDIERLADKWPKENISTDFEYRKYQKDTVVNMVYSLLSDKDNYILTAPTGSGKSIIAVCVAGILSSYFNLKGFIVVSDLSLLEQYETYIRSHFPSWGIMKGQQNYICIKNMMTFKMGECKLLGSKSYSDIYSNFECSKDCEYLIEREHAIMSDVVLSTYSFFLIYKNFTGQNNEHPFDQNDFVIFDEAHKINDIVQRHFSPKISNNDTVHFELIYDMLGSLSMKYRDNIDSIRNKLKASEDKSEIFSLMSEYSGELTAMKYSIESVFKNEKLDLKLAKSLDWLSENSTRFNEYCEAIKKCGVGCIIKNQNDAESVIMFNCSDESYLMESRVLSKCKYKVFMSATLGDHEIYSKEINVSDKYVASTIPNTFDYSMSPIFYIGDGYKMSYREKNESIVSLAPMVDTIFDMYHNKRGIVQTGNYELSKKVYELLEDKNKKRVVLYENSTEKIKALDRYKYSDDLVLIGPTLIEGISLDDDLCRFQIILKVPYASLSDKFVLEKMRISGDWYKQKAVISILQGVGRGIRNDSDWCVTFVLDGCFGDLINRNTNMFSNEFIERLKYLNPNILTKNNQI